MFIFWPLVLRPFTRRFDDGFPSSCCYFCIMHNEPAMAPEPATALRKANKKSRSKIVSLRPSDLHSRNRCAQDGIGRAGILQSKEESRAWCAHPVVRGHGKQPVCLHRELIKRGVGSLWDLAPHGRTCEAASFDFLI